MASKEKKLPEKNDESFKSEIAHRFKTHPFLFIGTVIILLIVIVAFVFVPAIVPSAQAGGDFTFGYYNKAPIKYAMNNYFYQAQQYLAQTQQPAPDDPNYMMSIFQIWRQAFEETVVHTAILDEMKQAGFVVPEGVVDREMAELPQFQENGRFSAARYRALDNSTRMNMWLQVKDSVAVNTYYSDFANLKTPSKEAAFISSIASPQRKFDAAVFPLNTYPDSEIVSYAEANPDLFKMIRLSQITVNSSEREARQILDSVKNGTTTFEEAATTNSQDWAAERSGDMGVFMTHELSWLIGNEEAREAVVKLAKGELSDVYQIGAGWTFYRVDEAAYPADPNDTSQKVKMRSYMMENLRGQIEDWVIAEAERFSAQAKESGFENAVTAGNITRRSFGPVSLNYGDSALFSSVASAGVSELQNAGTNQVFWNAAFKTPVNDLSQPFVVGDNVIVLLPLEETVLDEDVAGYIETYYPFWVDSGAQSGFRTFFLNNGKLEDRFQDTFWKIYRTN